MRRNLRRAVVVAAAVLLCGRPAAAQTVAIPGLFSTGVGSGGAPLPGGSVDPHYRIVSAPGVPTTDRDAFVLNDASVPAAWVDNTASSKWIWQSAGGVGLGTFTFRLTFDLSGLNASQAVISGRWAVDNQGTVKLNGVTKHSLTGVVTSNFDRFHEFTINSDFHPGINHLDFVATDNGGVGGLHVNNLSGTAPSLAVVPEPSSAALFFPALAGVLLCSRRRRR